jgi:hypothetical protein
VEEQDKQTTVATAQWERDKERLDYNLEQEEKRVTLFEKKMAAISPNLIQAMATLGETEMTTRLMGALAPLAISEQTSISNVMERVFKGSPMEAVLTNLTNKKGKFERAAD